MGKFSDGSGASARELGLPPTSPRIRAEDPASDTFREVESSASNGRPGAVKGKPRGHAFDAELDVCELDDRLRPSLPWAARSKEISRSHLVFRSRRMCYVSRQLLFKMHLIDSKPVGLFGQVRSCEYDGEGLYRVEVELLPLPSHVEATAWLSEA